VLIVQPTTTAADALDATATATATHDRERRDIDFSAAEAARCCKLAFGQGVLQRDRDTDRNKATTAHRARTRELSPNARFPGNPSQAKATENDLALQSKNLDNPAANPRFVLESLKRAPRNRPSTRAMSTFHYIDPRGRRSGPYSEPELKTLSQKGLLEPGGRIELDGLGQSWAVAEVPWLQTDAVRVDPDVPPPPDRFADAATIPPTSPAQAELRVALAESLGTAPRAACNRVTYVLLALLLPFIGVFGVHNIVAGYTTRGVVALVLSITTVFGIGCVIPPCFCIGVPVWIVLFTLSVIEAITVTADAQGRAFH
jgi:hypothetical protein